MPKKIAENTIPIIPNTLPTLRIADLFPSEAADPAIETPTIDIANAIV